jgi:hypothetical protein
VGTTVEGSKEDEKLVGWKIKVWWPFDIGVGKLICAHSLSQVSQPGILLEAINARRLNASGYYKIKANVR